jgi:hypothetical protein
MVSTRFAGNRVGNNLRGVQVRFMGCPLKSLHTNHFPEVTRMKFSLRSSAAAAALVLAPLGAVLVAQPAFAQHSAVVAPAGIAPAVIEQVSVRVVARPGADDAYFRLVGTPGARAFVRVPGLFDAMALDEVRPGVYEAIRTLDRNTDPGVLARTTGLLQNGTQRVIAAATFEGPREGGRGWGRQHRDEQAPQIAQVTPEQGERVSGRGWTRITARVSDDRSGIERVTMRVDGRDVSSRVRIEEGEVRYAEDLPRGRHTVDLQVRDRAGNVARRSWSFEVIERDRRGGHGYGERYGRDTDYGWGYGR